MLTFEWFIMEVGKEERCRLCLSDDITEDSIFEPHEDGIPFSTKIMLFTTIMVTPEDQYSKYICNHCSDMLDLFYHFRNTCFKTLISLHSTLDDICDSSNMIIHDTSVGPDTVKQDIYNRFNETTDSGKIKESLDLQHDIGIDLGIDKVVSEEIVFEERENDSIKETLTGRQFQVGCYIPLVDDESNKDTLPLLRRFKCINCRKVFSSLNELDGHWDFCEEWMNNEIPMDVLINPDNTDENTIYEDEENVEEFGNDDECIAPKKNPKSKEFCCETCGQVFKQLWLLTRHIQVKHIRVRPYSCSHCPRRFFDKYELKYHQRLHEDVEDFCCNVCGRRFARRSGLRAHMRSHTGEKPFKCQTCGKSFAHLNSLITHVRVHTGERPYTCKFCPRTFAQYSTAKSHEDMHKGGLRLHQCEVCDRMYKTEGELRAHCISHEGVLEHRCVICNKSFKKYTELRKHNQQYHFQTKQPFPCSECSKSYMTVRELEEHSTVHRGKCPYTCLFCSKKYRMKSTLRKHMEKHHKNIVSEPLDNTGISLNLF